MAKLLIAVAPDKLKLPFYEVRLYTMETFSPSPTSKPDVLESLIAEKQQIIEEEHQEDFSSQKEETSFVATPKFELNPEALKKKSWMYIPKGQHPFKRLYEKLTQQADTSNPIRIIHYGDSQLEGDRVTEHFRNRMQQIFGGGGVGLIAVEEIDNARSTLVQSSSGNLIKYATYGNEKKGDKGKYGLMGSYFEPDSVEEGQLKRISLDFQKSRFAKNNSNQVDVVKVLFKNTEDTLNALFDWNGIRLAQEKIGPAPQPQTITFPVVEAFEKCHIEFRSSGNPIFHAVSMEKNFGVAVDNISMRGSSGGDFTKMSRTMLKKQFEQLNVDFLILQYGVNLVPYMIENFDYHERSFYGQLKFLKSLKPDMDILVVGVSDMSRKDGTIMKSYPNIPFIRDLQKKAALKAGCAFWDLYEAMGGENSMPAWVEASPALAAKDYTHFTRKGAKLVAELMLEEILRQFESHKKSNEETTTSPDL